MKRFTVSADLLVPVLVEVEAETEDEAELMVLSMRRSYLLEHACTDDDAIDINIDDVTEAP